MKKSLFIAFLAIFLFNAIGYYFTFGIEDLNIKERVFSLLEDQKDSKNLEPVTVSLSDFNSKIKTQSSFSENEFVWNGNRYDISSVAVSGNMVTITAYHDKDEEKLFSSLVKHFESSSNSSSGSASKNILKEPVKYVVDDLLQPLYLLSYSQSIFSGEQSAPAESMRFVLTPPPNA